MTADSFSTCRPAGRRLITGCIICFMMMVGTDVWGAEPQLAIFPSQLTFSGPEVRQRVVVQWAREGDVLGEVTKALTLTSSNPKVVAVEGSVAIPVGNGEATIVASVGQAQATATVHVSEMDKPFHWNFRNHVQSVLAKAGCSSGACHGALAGKNGFKLSLRGYDPEGDYLVLTRQMRGRRIVPSDPGRSMILTKPTGRLPHGGGLRFEEGSLEYRVIAQWIAAGAMPPTADDPRLERLEILPPAVLVEPGAKQQFIVEAHFSDGRVEDVTAWAKYTSTNLSVAEVNASGQVSIRGHGEGAITAWYLSQVVVATVTAPQEHKIPPQVFADAARQNLIDDLVLAKLQRLNLRPSPAASDAEFLRRAYLDTIGALPTADEVRAFLADDSSGKRAALIDRLLERPEFIDYWSYRWSDLLLVNSAKLRQPAMWAYYKWIRDRVAANTPWDELVYRLITATGSTLENGATNYFVLHNNPAELAETTSLAFLGTSIGCAKCHNHPLEKWTNDQYYAMANLFARVRTKNAAGTGNRIVFSAAQGDLIQPLRGRPQPPQPLDGDVLPADFQGDRREPLARWLVSRDNPLFARAIVNRVWANFMGVGLVEKVDDLRQTNPASNEPLLAALAGFLVEHDFDLKSLMRLILGSATYQRSSQVLPENAEDDRFYARYYPRRLMAEVLLDAYSQVAGVPTQFPGYPKSWHALELPDAAVSSYFLKTFGRPERTITCVCERTAEPSMVQVLHITNGDTLNKKLEAKGSRPQELLDAGLSDEAVIDEVYLSGLSRFPTAEEKQKLLAVFAETPKSERRQVVEDLFWGVLSTKEFLFNH